MDLQSIADAIAVWVSTLNLGSVPDWIGAAATGFAFIVAALAFRRDVRIRFEAQARQIYSQVTFVLDARNPGQVFALGQRTATATIDPGVGTIGTGGSLVLAHRANYFEVTIFNRSNETIGPVLVGLVNRGLATQWGEQTQLIEVVPPGETSYGFFVKNPYPNGEPSVGSAIKFRDAGGKWWRRILAEPVKRVPPARGDGIGFSLKGSERPDDRYAL